MVAAVAVVAVVAAVVVASVAAVMGLAVVAVVAMVVVVRHACKWLQRAARCSGSDATQQDPDMERQGVEPHTVSQGWMGSAQPMPTLAAAKTGWEVAPLCLFARHLLAAGAPMQD